MSLETIQEAIRRENLDGWLFYNFRHRDRLADLLLSVPEDRVNTRRWFAVVFPDEEPLKIAHAVEASLLDHLPGRTRTYVGHDELFHILAELGGLDLAANFSEELPIVSFLDFGTARLLDEAGIRIVSSSSLIQRVYGILGPREQESHVRAAEALYEIVDRTWRMIESRFSQSPPTESEVQRWMMDQLSEKELTTDHPPIVAAGNHSADPHFAPRPDGGSIEQEVPLQLDIWAKEPDGIYADISWIGFIGRQPPADVQSVFDAVTAARDEAVRFIADELEWTGPDTTGGAVVGFDVDRRVREVIAGHGYERGIRHRTGHGIDTECHGSGVNLDSVEFPDRRALLEGSLFSVEPGIYLEELGMRSEIDVLIRNGKPIITGGTPQYRILTFSTDR